MKQVERLDFGPGISYRFEGADTNGNSVNQILEAPWPIVGSVILHGHDAPRAETLSAVIQADSVGAASAVFDGQGGGFNGLLDDLVNNSELDALWTVIGSLDGADVVAIDALPSRNDSAAGRVVIIITDNGNGAGQLLYAWHNRPGPNGIEILAD